MYYFKLVSLENCPYSIACIELFTNNMIKHELVQVKYDEKEKFKSDEIHTFPQIYLKKKKSKGSILIGGYTDIKKYYDIINLESSYNDRILNKIKVLLNKNNNIISNRSVLRVIQLLFKNNST
jgi:glutaredoxin